MSCMHQWDRLADRCSICLMTAAQYHAASSQLGRASAIGIQAVMMFSYASALQQEIVPIAPNITLVKANKKERDKRSKSRAWGIWVRW